MDRVDQLRSARNSPHVTFTEYLKLRVKCSGIVFIFEGRQCPNIYMQWVPPLMRGLNIGGQIIARGKKQVLQLRNIIKNNSATSNDLTIYFVDKDYDLTPKCGEFSDVYVTRGYSIENEIVNWPILESFVRAHFDIANSDDQDALVYVKDKYVKLFQSYILSSIECQRIIFTCRLNGFDCLPGDNIFDYLFIDWSNDVVPRKYRSIDELMATMKVDEERIEDIRRSLEFDDPIFSALDPILDWRGKFHFGFVKKFLIILRDARMAGSAPFSRPSKVDSDPTQPSVLGALGGFCNAPACLVSFLQSYIDERGLAGVPN